MNTEMEGKVTPERFDNILVGRKKIEWVAYNHEFTAHAKLQFVRRGPGASLDLKDPILNSPVAWKTHSGCIAIALDLYRYVVVALPEMGSDMPAKIVTIVDLEPSQMNVVDKLLISYREFCRPKQGFRTV